MLEAALRELDRRRHFLLEPVVAVSAAQQPFSDGFREGHPAHRATSVRVLSSPASLPVSDEHCQIGHGAGRAPISRKLLLSAGAGIAQKCSALLPVLLPNCDTHGYFANTTRPAEADLIAHARIPWLLVSSLYAAIRSRVTGPGIPAPIVLASTLTTGITSAAVPVRKHSLAV
jgi:hypothetical protein